MSEVLGVQMDPLEPVAVVVVTWNQTSLTLDCLAALVAAGVDQRRIWTVDNGSDERAEPAIAAQFPHVRQLRLVRNVGFAGGCNAGAAAALAAGARSLLFLNNDALVELKAVSTLVMVLASDPGLGAVSPKVYYAGTSRIIQSVGIGVDPDSGATTMLGATEPDEGQYDRPAERDALFGCALLIRRAAWEQVGPFWEPFFNYAEEVDWCLRARRLGWRLLYVPEAVVWHRTSSSLGWDSPLKTYLIARNQLYLRRRHQRGGWRGLRGLARALVRLVRTAARYARMRKWMQARAIALAVWDAAVGRTGDTRTPGLQPRRPVGGAA